MPRATVNGIEMFYEERGEGCPLVLVHGLGTGSADWEFQFPALAKKYHVIAPDQRGFGQTEKPPGPYSIGQFADDLRSLLDHLGLTRVHLCGISMGGAVAFQFAVDNPRRVLSVTTINSQPSFELNTMTKRLMVWTRRMMARHLGLERESRIQLYRNFPGPRNRAIRRRLAGRFQNDLEPYLAGIDAVAGWTVVDRLDQIRVPVMFLVGERDFTHPEEKAHFARMIADARVVVLAGARHAMHLERPAEVNAAILSFLERADAREA
ncbi:MAG: alpha/beta hydrolase [Gammaproteobacteria bacterium]|nr:alpha/beta hydrolase [Gammaproteobacteria bacterium]